VPLAGSPRDARRCLRRVWASDCSDPGAVNVIWRGWIHALQTLRRPSRQTCAAPLNQDQKPGSGGVVDRLRFPS